MGSSKVAEKDATWPARVEKNWKSSNVRKGKFFATPIAMKRSRSRS
jgi:hypothetical protein